MGAGFYDSDIPARSVTTETAEDDKRRRNDEKLRKDNAKDSERRSNTLYILVKS